MPQTDHPPLPSTDWDVLISGSGPTHSLLAVALSRAGKAVLQLDKNDYYGSASTAFYTLAELSAWAARVNAGLEAGFASAVLTTTACGDGGALGRGYTLSLAPDLVYWGGELLRVLRAADMADAVSWQAVGGWWVFVTDEEMAVPAPAGTGAAGGVLVGAGVKAARAVAGGKRRWNKGRKKEGEGAPREAEAVAEAVAGTEEGAKTTLRRMGRFREVACTFEDVAWSRDLTDRDRGHLGEFLRFVMKHDSRAPSDRKHLDLFTANSETPLQTFLTTTFPLPPPAIASLSSLTLLPTSPASTPLSRALPALARHFRSLGNIPDARSAAALTIAYGGTSELCQVLSRAGAVAGAVNVLARAITALGPAAAPAAAGQRRLTVALDNGEEVAADWVIGAPEDLPASATTTTTTAEAEAQTLSKAVYVLPCELPALFGKKYADEAVTPAVAVLMVPTAPAPGTGTAEKVPVYITARSSVTGECPRGHTLLHATTTLPHPSIDAAVRLLLAESSQPQTTQPLLSLLYTTTTAAAAATATATAGPGVVCLRPVDAGVVFDDGVVREARARFVAVVGGAEEERFMRLPDEARRMLEEMEDA